MKMIKEITNTALGGIAMAMGVATAVLLILRKIDTSSALMLLSIGVAALGLCLFTNKKM